MIPEPEKPNPQPPELNNPLPNDVPAKQVSGLMSVINSSTEFITLASQEWFNFLIDQPVNPPFEFDAKFADESKRSARLVVIVVVLSLLVIGGASLIGFLSEGTMTVINRSLMVLIGAFLIAIFYKPIAYLFGIKVYNGADKSKKNLSLRQILFSVLYTCVPWIPIFAFLRIAVIPVEGILLILLLLAFWICCFYVFYNFAKTIIVITNCQWYRVALSLLIPLLFLGLFILFRY